MYLPNESSYARDTGQWWSVEHELAATGIDLLHAHYRAMLAVNGVKPAKLPKPFSISRPTPGVPVKPVAQSPLGKPVRPKATKDQVLAILAMSHKTM